MTKCQQPLSRKKLYTTMASVLALGTLSFSAYATDWQYLSAAPSASQCQQIKNGSALLVVGADGCTETAPWVGYLNFSPSPEYKKSGSHSEQAIMGDIDHLQKSGVMPGTSGQDWDTAWKRQGYAADNNSPFFKVIDLSCYAYHR